MCFADRQKLAFLKSRIEQPTNVDTVPLCGGDGRMQHAVSHARHHKLRTKCTETSIGQSFVFEIKGKTDIQVLCRSLQSARSLGWLECPLGKALPCRSLLRFTSCIILRIHMAVFAYISFEDVVTEDQNKPLKYIHHRNTTTVPVHCTK